MGVSKNRWFSPQIIHFNRGFHYKPSILGYPYFWKHPNRRDFLFIFQTHKCFFSPPGNHLFKVIPSTVGLFSRVKTPILGERRICKTDGSLFKQQKRHQGLVDFTFFSGCFHKKGGNPTSIKHPSSSPSAS